MEYRISLDGGGSKLQAILFDEHYHLLASACSGNINENFSSAETVRENVRACFCHLFSEICPDRISSVYGAFAGRAQEMLQQLRSMISVDEVHLIGEACMGLHAAGLKEDGLIALSGTGSDIYWVAGGEEMDVVGGWGALIADEGSGYYIGRMAVNAAIRDWEGRGPKTLLTQLICQEMDHPELNHAVLRIYNTMAPTARIASLSRLVSEAVLEEDAVAQEILNQNAQSLAEQTAVMLRRHPQCKGLPVVMAGGAWKTYTYEQRFYQQLQKVLPGTNVLPRRFEPVIGGVLGMLFDEKGELSEEDFRFLREEYQDFYCGD